MSIKYRPLFLLASLLTLACHWQCSDKQGGTSPARSPYVPDDWDGVADWPSSRFQIRDLD